MVQTSIIGWLKKQDAPTANPSPSKATLLPLASISALRPPERLDEASCVSPDARRPFASLPACVTIEMCGEKHVAALRRLNSILLPIPYQEKFYEEITQDETIKRLTWIAFWHDEIDLLKSKLPNASGRVVAGIRCRILPAPPDEPFTQDATLYISTLATLSPYRRKYIATHLLLAVVDAAVEEHRIKSVMAHVWEGNEEALEWYKRQGFHIVAKDQSYYRRLAPKSMAWVMKKDIRPSDLASFKEPG